MFRGLGTLCALAVVASTAAADVDNPTAGQKQAFYAKPSVVRIVGVWEVQYAFDGRPIKQYVGGTGSGFFVSSDGFVATNAHVVQDIKEGEDGAKRKAAAAIMKELEQKLGGNAEQIQAIAAQIHFVKATQTAEIVLPDGTKLPYEIRAYGAPVGEGKDVAILKVDIKDAPNLVIGDSGKVNVQDHLLAIGYPGAADLEGLLDDKSQLEASVTDGTVSAIKRTTDGEPVIQVTVPITHGNSGGPAINDKGEVIGLSTFGSRNEVQGFNFLVAASTVKKFVKEAKADNKLSKTAVEWRKSLDAFWAMDLDKAISGFEDVATLFPTHVDAGRMMKQARALKKEGKGKKPVTAAASSGGSGAGIAIGVTLGVLALGAIVFFAVKKKKPGAHPHPHAAHPHAAHPHAPAHGPPGHPHAPHGTPLGVPHNAPGPMMAGRIAQPGATPVAKTVAIGASASQPIAATAFGSMSIGSLSCVRGLLNGQKFALTHQGILIGRQPGLAQIVINDGRASGKHVWIGYENGVLVAIDQGTTNGTYVNDVRNGRISKQTLRDGDVVIVSEPDCLSLQLKLS
ncbi:MAG TPA: trypsin-like peptidase domain-containing protein [Kofleriaceae bacterium]